MGEIQNRLGQGNIGMQKHHWRHHVLHHHHYVGSSLGNAK